MTFTVTKMWSKDNGSAATADGRKWTASFSEGYQVTHPTTATPIDVLQAEGIPAAGTVYPGTDFVFAKAGKPTRVSPILSVVIIDYEGETGSSPTQSPMTNDYKITWSSDVSEEQIDMAVDGTPIVTANYEPIAGGSMTLHDLTATITRNYNSINLPAIHAYLHSVNSDTFLDFAPGIAKLESYSANNTYTENGQGFWVVTAKIVFRTPYFCTAEQAWHLRLRHEGYYVKNPAAGSTGRIRATDDYGEPVTKPVLLDSAGGETQEAEWLFFPRYTPLPYNALGLV
jgi:hypothetical protein